MNVSRFLLRAGGVKQGMSELTPRHVLADLFDSDDFPGSVRNLDEAAKIVVQRLIDSGFDIKPWEPNR
jgi:hypothetical protein